jgi:23S rRNA (uracil1939-C5)-methyltransferase
MKLTIEKVIYGGQGLARIPADTDVRDGMSVFVPFTLPGEVVETEITQQRRGYCVGDAQQIVQASDFRADPPCPWFATCGGCHLQHGVYAYQVELKREMLLESLKRAGRRGDRDLPEVSLLVGAPLGYRNRIRLQVQTQPKFSIGYRQAKSHRMTAIDRCPIAAPLLEECIGAMRLLGSRESVPADAQEIEIFTNHDQSELFMKIWTQSRARGQQDASMEFFAKMQREIPQLIGAQLLAAEKGNLHSARARGQWGRQHVSYRVAGREYQVGAGSFFQVNRILLDEFVAAVTSSETGACAWDLFAGVGLFSLALAERFSHVIAVESSAAACKDLRHNLLDSRAEYVQASTQNFLQGAVAGRQAAPDLILLDPPRAGLGMDGCRLLAEIGSRKIVYVSCDPATLGRDLAALIQSGYRLLGLQLVDMFPQTYHMEAIAMLER